MKLRLRPPRAPSGLEAGISASRQQVTGDPPSRRSRLGRELASAVRLVRRQVHLVVLAFCGALGAADWPQFRGPGRDGICLERNLLQRWPEGGPRLAWRAGSIGSGYSSPVVQGELVLITGDSGEELVVTALDRTRGAVRWKAAHGRAWKGQFPGARSTCTLADGRLYLMDPHGRVACADATTGQALWSADILERFKGKVIQWGLSECLLVDRGRVIVTAGGDGAFLAALDAATGATVWAGPPLRFTRTVAYGGKAVEPPTPDVDRAGYASPVAFEVGGRKLLAATGGRHFVVADAETGELLWTREVPAVYEVIGAIPVWCEAGLLFAAPDVGALLFRVAVADGKVTVTEAWRHPIDNCHGALLYRDGLLFGSGYRLYRPWAALDAATGAVRGEFKDLPKGCVLYADDRLYALAETGEMALLRFAGDGFAAEGRFRLPEASGGDHWSHPAIAEGHLFVRCREALLCYDLRAPVP